MAVEKPRDIPADDLFWDFWLSPIGAMRQQFLATRKVPTLPKPGQLAPWVNSDSLFEVVPHQVRRDIDQFEYLVSKHVLAPDVEKYVVEAVLPEYRRMLEVALLVVDGRTDVFFLTNAQPEFAIFFSLQKRALHLHSGDSIAGGAISPELDLEQAQAEYLQKDHRLMVIDDFFTPDALQQLRDYLLESTIWTEAKFGHVGAYVESGFASPLVAQIDQELRSKLPAVLGNLELESAWAYMYDGSLGGVGTHADDAQVQINFFITPTEANLGACDGTYPSGGLVIYGVGPPKSWGVEKYNNVYGRREINDVLASVGHWNKTIPYVQNRAILFDSTYFHRSDCMKFKKGYKNRRINVTFLYGKRKNLNPRGAVEEQNASQDSGSDWFHTKEARTISDNMDHFYTSGENWLGEEGWAMLREMGVTSA